MKKIDDIMDKIHDNEEEIDLMIENYQKRKNNNFRNTIIIYSIVAIGMVMFLIIKKLTMRNWRNGKAYVW